MGRDDGRMRLVVTDKRPEADAVVSIQLADPEGLRLPSWTPGAHIELFLDEHMSRQYSLCGDPDDSTRWRIAVLREPHGRGGSVFVHDHVHEGDQIEVAGPRNHFRLEPAEQYLFIAGGIGITPILPMVKHVKNRELRWRLLYGGRQHSSMAFTGQLTAFGSNVTLYPQNSKGMLPLESILSETSADTAVYGCGPPALLEALEAACSVTGHELHLERFEPGQFERDGDQSFEVELRASGVTLEVPPSKSILEVIEDAGISIMSSCRTGTCGTCEIPVLEGTVDHRDTVLTDAEKAAGELIIACTSRSSSRRIVLDY